MLVKTINYGDNFQKEVTIATMHDALTKAHISPNQHQECLKIICWLPTITQISITITYDNEWFDITFNNNETIRLYNTGLEDVLYDLLLEEED